MALFEIKHIIKGILTVVYLLLLLCLILNECIIVRVFFDKIEYRGIFLIYDHGVEPVGLRTIENKILGHIVFCKRFLFISPQSVMALFYSDSGFVIGWQAGLIFFNLLSYFKVCIRVAVIETLLRVELFF